MSIINSVLIPIIVSIFVLFLIREIITWYWKINQIVRIQESILDLLGQIEINTRSTKLITNNKNFVSFKVGNSVRLTENKINELRNSSTSGEDYNRIGRINVIEGDYANVYFGKEIRRVAINDLEIVN